MLKKLHKIVLSVKTAFALMLLFSLTALIGSVVHPRNLAFFSGIDDTPLFKWLKEADHIELTWWIYGLVIILFLLAINTIFCSVDALVNRLSRRTLLLKLSPQIIHLGVLLIMLGHLLTASIGTKMDVFIQKGEKKDLLGKLSIQLKDTEVTTDEEGYDTDWTAYILVSEEEVITLKPSRPVYRAGLGFFVQSVTKDDDEVSALVRVCDDPGAFWALSGGIIIIVGSVLFVYARFRN